MLRIAVRWMGTLGANGAPLTAEAVLRKVSKLGESRKHAVALDLLTEHLHDFKLDQLPLKQVTGSFAKTVAGARFVVQSRPDRAHLILNKAVTIARFFLNNVQDVRGVLLMNTSLLSALFAGNESHQQEAIQLFESLKKRHLESVTSKGPSQFLDARVFDPVLNYYLSSGRDDKAFDLIDSMISDPLLPHPVANNLLILNKAFAERGEPEKMAKLKERAETAKISWEELETGLARQRVF